MNRFNGRIALITGSGGDIGTATCKRLLEEGAKVVLTDHIEENLKNKVQEMVDLGFSSNNIKYTVGDIRIQKDCNQIAEFTQNEFGQIDILVATAGIVKHHPIEDLTVEDWQDVIDINLTGVYNCAKAVVSPMKKQKYGRMIFISSLGGRTGRPGVGVNYAASKAGVIGLTQALGYELGPWNITVNSIAPGPIQGKMFDTLPAEKIEHLKTGVRIPRLGSPSEVAAAIAYMASEEAGWTTGEILDVNGGLYF